MDTFQSNFNFWRKVFLKVPPIFNQIFNMQVENNIESKLSSVDSEQSQQKEPECGDNKQLKAENRIARYQQKPERKASKMLVRLLQWADKLVIKFFTKKFLPNQLEIFFNREARANKVELKKAQIDYSVEDFAVRLYVFWVSQNYFEKVEYQDNLKRLLLELRDELTRKKKNLNESYQLCSEQSQQRQKEEELKWMGAIINGLNTFIDKYVYLTNEDDVLEFLLDITSNIMIDCLRKPGNKLCKKKEKLRVKIKYFQDKISEIIGNPQLKMQNAEKQKKPRVIHKNTIIITPGQFPIDGLTRTSSNTSAFQKFKPDQNITGIRSSSAKKQDFEVKLQYPKKSEPQKRQQTKQEMELLRSNQKGNQFQKYPNNVMGNGEDKIEEEVSIVDQNIQNIHSS